MAETRSIRRTASAFVRRITTSRQRRLAPAVSPASQMNATELRNELTGNGRRGLRISGRPADAGRAAFDRIVGAGFSVEVLVDGHPVPKGAVITADEDAGEVLRYRQHPDRPAFEIDLTTGRHLEETVRGKVEVLLSPRLPA